MQHVIADNSQSRIGGMLCLYGISGCGKSSSVEVIARELGVEVTHWGDEYTESAHQCARSLSASDFSVTAAYSSLPIILPHSDDTRAIQQFADRNDDSDDSGDFESPVVGPRRRSHHRVVLVHNPLASPEVITMITALAARRVPVIVSTSTTSERDELHDHFRRL